MKTIILLSIAALFTGYASTNVKQVETTPETVQAPAKAKTLPPAGVKKCMADTKKAFVKAAKPRLQALFNSMSNDPNMTQEVFDATRTSLVQAGLILRDEIRTVCKTGTKDQLLPEIKTAFAKYFLYLTAIEKYTYTKSKEAKNNGTIL